MKPKNRIDDLFSRKEKDILSIYLTAGYPNIDDTIPLCQKLEASGVDLIEVGFPFSDPVSDGPVIQESSGKAIKNGMSLEVLFKQLEGMRQKLNIPIILMGYLNPVLQFGFDRFCSRCREVGVDGLIIPDLPVAEFQKGYEALVHKENLHFIFLVTSATLPERVRLIDSLSTSFIYAVSSHGVTGGRLSMDESRTKYLQTLREMKLGHPILCGFGISDRESLKSVCKFTAGGIIGSALIAKLGNSADPAEEAGNFVEDLKS